MDIVEGRTELLIEFMQKTIEQKDEQIRELRETIENLQTTVASLNETIEEFRRKFFGSSSERSRRKNVEPEKEEEPEKVTVKSYQQSSSLTYCQEIVSIGVSQSGQTRFPSGIGQRTSLTGSLICGSICPATTGFRESSCMNTSPADRAWLSPDQQRLPESLAPS